MKKRRFFILFLCALLLQGMHSAGAENIMDTPEWVTGTLLISLAGSETIVDPAKVPVDQYVCAFDFENRRINSVRVPYHSRLMDGSYPLVVYSEMPGKNSLTFDHHAYSLAQFFTSDNGNSPELQIDDRFVSQRHPISVLDTRIGNDTTELYYLCQGVSASGQAEYQLVGEGDDLTVYQRFSSDCFLSRITASVSPDGKIT